MPRPSRLPGPRCAPGGAAAGPRGAGDARPFPERGCAALSLRQEGRRGRGERASLGGGGRWRTPGWRGPAPALPEGLGEAPLVPARERREWRGFRGLSHCQAQRERWSVRPSPRLENGVQFWPPGYKTGSYG